MKQFKVMIYYSPVEDDLIDVLISDINVDCKLIPNINIVCFMDDDNISDYVPKIYKNIDVMQVVYKYLENFNDIKNYIKFDIGTIVDIKDAVEEYMKKMVLESGSCLRLEIDWV